jgi:Cu(I)/Ag(I) efflux system membrane fusion protein
MKLKIIVISLIAAGALGAAGFGVYRVGMQRGMTMSSANAGANPSVNVAANAAAPTAMLDPSNWGIPEGEAATRRHIENKLKAGEIDPMTGRKILFYHDPMVPGKNFEDPGKSPFMNMMLVPSYAGSDGADGSSVTVSSRIQQNIGLRTEAATEAVLTPEISAVGVIAWNERDQATVQARAIGFVEKLHVRATFDNVRKGQALLDLYVPDWVAAQEDFLAVGRMQGSNLAPLKDAARSRMRQAGMDDGQIRLVESTGKVQARVTIRAPIDGVVTELMAREGMTVMPGMTLARIYGTATVWANAEVPESQVAQLKTGTRVEAKSPALPNARFEGRVQALLPDVDPKTRTLKARMEIANTDKRLVPGMFVQMTFAPLKADKTVLVPTEAIIQTGKRSLIMLAEEGGKFRPVEVVIGLEANGKTEIKSGVKVGQQVVMSGQFLIDSEASLKGVEARLNRDADKNNTSIPIVQTHKTKAYVEDITGDMIMLSHPAIASLKWPAMTMEFKLMPGSGKSGIATGQDVDIEFRMPEDDGPQITEIRRSVPVNALSGEKGNMKGVAK